uniref:Twisted gastrulation BMP signaling modulator 1 n=1 Tax=Monopterus albus TaxID=43700 RepID=A0A3Q3JSL4_MONAL
MKLFYDFVITGSAEVLCCWMFAEVLLIILPSFFKKQHEKFTLCQCRPSDGNCSCCKECMLCLGNLWEECCDCVGMCNPKNYSDSPATSKSTVEELHRPIPSLFRALTEGDAPINMMVVSFPVAEELSHHENLVSFLESLDSQHQNVSVPGNSIHTTFTDANLSPPHTNALCNARAFSKGSRVLYLILFPFGMQQQFAQTNVPDAQ